MCGGGKVAGSTQYNFLVRKWSEVSRGMCGEEEAGSLSYSLVVERNWHGSDTT